MTENGKTSIPPVLHDRRQEVYLMNLTPYRSLPAIEQGYNHDIPTIRGNRQR